MYGNRSILSVEEEGIFRGIEAAGDHALNEGDGWIRDLREDHDLTQRQLAAELGITQPQYFRYEQGFRDLPTDILLYLAERYNTSTDYILGKTNEPKPYPKA